MPPLKTVRGSGFEVRCSRNLWDPALAGLLAALLAIGTTGISAQSTEPIRESVVRTFTREARSEARGDSDMLVMGLDRRVRERWGNFESFPLRVVARDDVTITLTTPFMAYRKALIEHLLIRQPIDALKWTPSAFVSVSPERIDAPDITAIVLTRDGAAIPPLTGRPNPLRPMTFTNGSGGRAVLHGGDVHFPISALAPGARVTISAVPAQGDALVLVLEEQQLRELR